MKLRELPAWEKPREKLLREGVGSLSNTEILAVLLGTGTRTKTAMDLAGEILSLDPDGIRFLSDCSPEELRRPAGMGDAKICTILAAAELGRRIAASRIRRFGQVGSPEEIAQIYMEIMRYHRKEHFLCILLNARGDIIEETEVSVGDISSAVAEPREVFIAAIRRNASAVIFLHNHPSGDPTPSREDRATTERLVEAGKLLGIPVLDHIIIGDGVYVSMKKEGADFGIPV